MTRAKLTHLATVAAIQFAALAGGWLYWYFGIRHVCDWIHLILLVLAFVLFVYGIVLPWVVEDGTRQAKWLGPAVMAYFLGLLVAEGRGYGFVYVWTVQDVLIAVVYLLPLVAVVGPLVRARAWCTLVGDATAIAVFVHCLTADARTRSGIGFLGRVYDWGGRG